MGSAVSVYLRLVGAQLRSKMQYRVSFIMESIGQFLVTFIDFATVAVILTRFPTLDGWNLGEIAFLYGMSGISFSLTRLFSRGLEIFEQYVQMGELDRILTRPTSPFLQLMSVELSISRLGRLGQALVIFTIGLSSLSIRWDIFKFGLLLMAILAGIVIFLALYLLGAITAIWTVATAEFTNIFTDGGTYLAGFPLTIYQEWFRNFFIFIVPLGFLNFLPALIILDKPAILGLPLWAGWLTLPVAVGFLGLALLAWRFGLKKYQSTGS